MNKYQEQCSDNRFEIIEETKNYIINATNIETSIEEMKVLDCFCFRLWQLGLTKRNKDKLKILEEKEKPKKPIPYLNSLFKCENCKSPFQNYHYQNRCLNCGQALDWSDKKC